VTILVGVVATLATACVVMTAAAMVAVRRGAEPSDVAAFIPGVARLLFRLLRDRSIPLRIRARILIAVAYNAQPINLIPDFVPVIGFADNVIVTAWALRSTVRGVGREVVADNWSGSPAGLVMVFRLAGLEEQPGNSGVCGSPREELS
jgi:uncharacterized membrane protein YkvA (DUF1232 family)